jgi:hypothetical protein
MEAAVRALIAPAGCDPDGARAPIRCNHSSKSTQPSIQSIQSIRSLEPRYAITLQR